MRFSEIVLEDIVDDDKSDSESDIIINMKSDLIDYLTSLSATGAKGDIPTKKLVSFMQHLGYDVNEPQIADLLQGTAFDADSHTVSINKIDDTEGKRFKHNKQLDKKKVNTMARGQLDKELNQ